MRITGLLVLASLLGACSDSLLVLPPPAPPPPPPPPAPVVPSAHWYALNAWLYADGVSSTSVTLIIVDANNQPAVIPPGAVTMATTRGRLSAVSCGTGSCSAVITSTTSDETAVITARYNDQSFAPPLSIHFDHRHWVDGAALSIPRMSLGVASVQGILYAVGGTSNWLNANPDWVNRVDAYDPVANAWTSRAPMPTARTDLAVGVTAGLLYAVGGHTDTDLNVVEAYDPATDTWSARAPMPTARGGLAVGVANGILYALGGRIRMPGSTYVRGAGESDGIAFADLPGNDATAVAEAYDPSTDHWVTLAPMPTPRAHLGVGVIDGVIYAVGGQDRAEYLGTLETYDPATNHWTTRASMPFPTGELTVAVVGGKLYAIGGFAGYSGTNRVQVYDPATNSWTETAPMITERFALGSAVINGSIFAIGGACYDAVYSSVETLTP